MAHSYTPPGSSSSSRNPPRIPSQLGIAHLWPDSPSHSLGSSGDASEAGSSVASFNDIHLEVDGDEEEGIVMESRGGRGQQGVQGPGVGQGAGASPYGRGAVTILTSDYDEVDALLHSIYEKTQQDAWFAPGPSAGAIADACLGGVALRVAAGAPSLAAPPAVAAAAAANAEDEEASGTSTPGGDRGPQFRVFPYNAPHLVPFEAAVRHISSPKSHASQRKLSLWRDHHRTQVDASRADCLPLHRLQTDLRERVQHECPRAQEGRHH